VSPQICPEAQLLLDVHEAPPDVTHWLYTEGGLNVHVEGNGELGAPGDPHVYGLDAENVAVVSVGEKLIGTLTPPMFDMS
jgi:hypothetical protein